MSYDPVRYKKNAEEFSYIYYSTLIAEECVAIGGRGIDCFIVTLEAALVGLQEKFLPLLDRAIDWINIGIDQREKEYGFYYHQSRLREVLALSLWYRDDVERRDIWEDAIIWFKEFIEKENIYHDNQIKDDILIDLLLYCLHAEKYNEGIEIYKDYSGCKKLTRKRMSNSEAGLAYAYCLHYANGDYRSDELLLSANNLFNINMDREWISRGRPYRGLSWLKIVYWKKTCNLTPLEVWLKAYDHMPHVKRPDFV